MKIYFKYWKDREFCFFIPSFEKRQQVRFQASGTIFLSGFSSFYFLNVSLKVFVENKSILFQALEEEI